MSNFENEYKKYSKESTPDLWARIEAGVDAYEAEKANNTDKVVPITNNKRVFKKHLGLIAVAACILIAVPAMIFTSKDTEKRLDFAPAAASNASMTEEVAKAPMDEDAVDEAATCEAAEPMGEAEYEESEELMTEDTVEKSATLSGDSVKAMWDSEASPSSAEVIVIDDNIPDSKIRFFIKDNISDFTVLNITITGITEDGDLIYTSSTAYEGGSYKSGDELILEMSFPGDIPNYAISFVDSAGEEHVLTVSESGNDGSIVLSEINK